MAALGEVILDGQVVGYFRWSTICSGVSSPILLTAEAAWQYADDPPPSRCACAGILAQLYHAEGQGAWWWGKVCLEHQTILTGHTADTAELTASQQARLAQYRPNTLAYDCFSIPETYTGHPVRRADADDPPPDASW
jgi:hypothetical protein